MSEKNTKNTENSETLDSDLVRKKCIILSNIFGGKTCLEAWYLLSERWKVPVEEIAALMFLYGKQIEHELNEILNK